MRKLIFPVTDLLSLPTGLRGRVSLWDKVDGDSLGTARATLVGDVLPVPDEEVGEAREHYLSRPFMGGL